MGMIEFDLRGVGYGCASDCKVEHPRDEIVEVDARGVCGER